MRILSSIIGFTIPIPVILIPIVWALWTAGSYWDRSAAVKEAVKSRVSELVSGAELEALREQVKAEQLRSELQRRIAERQVELRVNAEVALREYQEDAASEKNNLEERLRALQQGDGAGIGVVKPELYDSLQNR